MGLLNITLPVIFFPFTSVSWNKDYGQHQYTITIEYLYYQYVRDWFDYLGGAIYPQYHSSYRRLMKMTIEDVSEAVSEIGDEFTIMFHLTPRGSRQQFIFQFGDGTGDVFSLYYYNLKKLVLV